VSYLQSGYICIDKHCLNDLFAIQANRTPTDMPQKLKFFNTDLYFAWALVVTIHSSFFNFHRINFFSGRILPRVRGCNSLLFKRFATTKKRNPGTYNWMIHGFVKKGDVQQMARVYEDMKQPGVKPTVVTFTSLINGFGKKWDVQQMARVYEHMKQQGVKPNAVTFNSLIDCFSKKEDVQQMARVYEEMKQQGVKADVVTFTALINGFGKKGDVRQMARVYEDMKQQGVRPDVVTFNSLINGFGKKRDVRQMARVYEDMKQQVFKPTVVTFTSLINGFGKKGDVWQMVLARKGTCVRIHEAARCKAERCNIQFIDKWFWQER